MPKVTKHLMMKMKKDLLMLMNRTKKSLKEREAVNKIKLKAMRLREVFLMPKMDLRDSGRYLLLWL